MSRTVFTKLRLLPEEKDQVKEMASSEGLSVSDLIRTRLGLSPLQAPASKRTQPSGESTLDVLAARLRDGRQKGS